MGDLTKDFDLWEFRQKDPLVEVPTSLVPNVRRLAGQLQVLRDRVGRRIVITSCYRTEAHNRAVGGEDTSRHLRAEAADFIIPDPDITKAQVYCAVLKLIEAGRMVKGGLGWYGEGGHTHYDVRGFMSPFNKSGGPELNCRGIQEIPRADPNVEKEKEEEDMAIMIQASGQDAVFVTNFVVKARVISREHRDQLIFSGVRGPKEVPQSFVDAIKDAVPGG